MSTPLIKKLSNGESLHWGILACGKISQDFMRALQFGKHPHKVVAAATSNSAERAQQFITDLGLELANGARAYGSYDQLLADPYIGGFGNYYKF